MFCHECGKSLQTPAPEGTASLCSLVPAFRNVTIHQGLIVVRIFSAQKHLLNPSRLYAARVSFVLIQDKLHHITTTYLLLLLIRFSMKSGKGQS